MSEAILKLLIGSSIKGSILILMVLAFRPFMKRVSHSMAFYLWLAVGIALVCPVSFATRWSVIPAKSMMMEGMAVLEADPGAIAASSDSMGSTFSDVVDSSMINNVGTGNLLGGDVTNQAVSLGHQAEQGFTAGIMDQIGNWFHGLTMADYALTIWITGMLVILAYALVRYMKLKKRLEISVKLKDHIYECDGIASPFVMGFVKPRIYLPSDLEPELWSSVVLHEQAHVKRNDPMWRCISLLLLGIHWFNPLVWISYVLFCRDMELACDEQVIKEMNLPEKKEYARALLSCSVKGRYVMRAPLAFAQIGVKERVVAMAKYQSPKALALVLSLALCLGLVGCSLTESAGKKEADVVMAGMENESQSDYENQYNTPVKVVIDRAEEGQYQYSKGEKLLYADDERVVFLTNEGIYCYVNQFADEMSYGLRGSLSLKNIDQGTITGVNDCEIFMEANGMCVLLHPLDQPFMYSYDFGSYLLKLPYNLANQEVLTDPFETSFTADNGDVYTLEGTGGQLKDLCYKVTGSRSETRHLFRGEIEVDLKQKYLPHNQTKYGESAFFTEEDFDQAAEQIANSSKDWQITGLLKYDGDATNRQMDVDYVNLWAKNAGIEADFNQSFSMSGQVHADSPWTMDDTDYEAGDYVGLWSFGKNPAGQIVLLASHIYYGDDEDTGEYIPAAEEEEAKALLKDGEFYFTQCYELCSDEYYSIKYGDSRIALVKEADMIWAEEEIKHGVVSQ